MKGMAAGLLLILLANPVTSAAVARDKAAYVGGTLARFNRTGTAIEGRVEISPRHFVFVPENGPHAARRHQGRALRAGGDGGRHPAHAGVRLQPDSFAAE